MVSRSILEKHGCTPEAWRKELEYPGALPDALTSPADTEDAGKKTQREKIDRLRRRVRSRIKGGIDHNLLSYRTCYALDQIWEAPFRQVAPTLIASLQKRYGSEEELKSALVGLGLNVDELLVDTEKTDPKSGEKIKALSIPTFFNIIVPLVRAYLQIRRAKIVNDRNLRPYIKYESAVNTAEERTKCEVLTSRIEVMSKQYDYLGTLNQAAFQMLLYGSVLQFTLEDWHFEEQLKYADQEDVKRFNEREAELKKKKPPTGNGEPHVNGDSPAPIADSNPAPADKDAKKKMIVGDEIKYTVREGLRYYHPHPTRSFWDMAHPMRTFNTDTGCEFAGHWRVLRWKEIKDNPDFYNKERVSWGQDAWWSSNTAFFNSVYNTCVMAWPTAVVPEGTQDREKFLADNSVYNETHGDNSVIVTEYREKLVPKDNGLGTYPHPIWVRFVVAGDGTIIYAQPIPYRAVIAARDNGDERKTEDASLGLQLAPHQDLLSNLLSQFIYASKQNLINFTLVDEDLMPKGFFDTIKNKAESMLRGVNIFPFSSKQWQKKMIDPAKNTAFYSHRFPALDTGGILNAMKLVIDLAERVLQFSNQEVAQAATHEQTKRELDIIHSATTNVLQYTGIPIDCMLEAQAVQLYEALMNFADDDFWAYIPSDHMLSREALAGLGITVVPGSYQKDKRLLVRAKKSPLMFWFFGMAPNHQQRSNNLEAARMISELVRDWFMNNPVGLAALGPDQLVDMANSIAKLAGLPLETPLRNAGMTTEEQNMASQQQLRAMVDEVLADVKKGSLDIMQDVQENRNAIDNLYATLQIPNPLADSNGNPGSNGSAPDPGADPAATGVVAPTGMPVA